MKREGLTIWLVICLLITTISISGCGPLLGAAVSTTKVIAAGMETKKKIATTKTFNPAPGIDTQESIIFTWGQPAETFVSPSGKVKIFIYNKEYKDHPVVILAFIGQKLHKIIPMTQKNYQGFRTELTGTQDIATLFGLSE